MSNKPEHSSYFKELIRRLKELRVSADNGEIIIPNDNEDILEFNEMELPLTMESFRKMSGEEKEALFLWLNKDDMPQA
jgi:hypothetical protein